MEAINKRHKRFEKLINKRILIYGTGKIAENLLEDLKKFNIVGIIDKTHFEGKLRNIPVLIWDDIDKNTADVIVIAALRKNYKTIFERIQYYCKALNIIIYGENGQNLSNEYEFKYLAPSDEKYFQKSETELKKCIDRYDVISFDLFDTLVMKKTLEREDVFDLIEEKIRNKGIIITDFKKKRRTAERHSPNDIDTIYHTFKSIVEISDGEIRTILQEEIDCEEKCLIQREKMVELMNYAIKKGKTVNIIADTYFPRNVIERFLYNLKISGYTNLYISNEYGTAKSTEILRYYRQDMAEQSCLHIGVGEYIDNMMLENYSIDFYEIKSAYKLLKMSSLRKLLTCICGIDNRLVLGMITAKIFNNPFILHATSGIVKIKKPDEFVILFIVPIVLIYMQNLIWTIQKKHPDLILFTARDGYLFKRIYENCFLKVTKIPSIYFLTSRKLCLRSTIDFEDNILNLYNNFSTENELKIFLEEFLQGELSENENEPIEVINCLLLYQNKLKQKSQIMRRNYLKYIDTIPFEQGKEYLFCELSSTGTIHEALNKIVNLDLDGFYLYKRMGFKERDLNITSVYRDIQGVNVECFRDLLEVVLTADVPSICAMDENGSPVYSPENRTTQELHMVEVLHKLITNFIQAYIELRGTDKIINKELPDIALGLCNYVNFEGEMKSFMDKKNVDDMTQKYICILNE